MPQDTIQAIYKRDYKPLGIKKREVAAHGALTAGAIIGLVLTAPIYIPIAVGISAGFGALRGIVALGLIGALCWWVFKVIEREDPLEVRKRALAKREVMKAELLEEIRGQKLLK